MPRIVATDPSTPTPDDMHTTPSAHATAADLPELAALRIALVGYGEVGRILGAALAAAGVREVIAFDVQMIDAAWREHATARASRDNVQLAGTNRDATATAHLVVCAVTAASTLAASEEIAAHCAKGAYVLDVNSASPKTKSRCAGIVENAQGRYVEAAVMTSVPPHGIRAPMLIGGPHAPALLPHLERLGFEATVGATTLGVVSATKLCRSVIIKGMEALVVESLLAARSYGVEREVIASLADTFPGLDWERQASYLWRRVVAHGRRRAEEMREAASMVEDAGVAPNMARATVEVQNGIAALRSAGVFDVVPDEADWRPLADRVLAVLRGEAAR